MLKRKRSEPGLVDGLEFATKAAKKPAGSRIHASKSQSSNQSKTKVRKASRVSVPPKNKIVCGVDYGTTFSGVSYVMTANSDARDIEVISDWSGAACQNETLEKVPSRIAFAHENKGMDKDKWGYQVEPGMKSYSWTKLLLDAGALTTQFDSEALSGKLDQGLFHLPTDVTAQQVAAAYLSHLYQYTMEKLTKLYSEKMMKVTSIDFWFTKPATWQESSNDATYMAAKSAGFGGRSGDRLFMITEPEAAAMAILSRSHEVNPGLYKTQTKVLIADLGGGTLDFQCLTINKLDPLRTEETIPGIGGKSGSTYIDCNLHQWLEETFGLAFRQIPSFKVGPGSKFMDDWEVIKKSFDGDDASKVFRLHLPALSKALRKCGVSSSSYDFEDFEVLISAADIANMFQPVLDKAFALVEDQLSDLKKENIIPFRIICLCGGLGSSKYVWRKFSEFCQDRLPTCDLVTDSRAWSAVVRGAAVRGLDGSAVLTKRSKRAYGIGVHQAFDADVDDEAAAFMCPVGGKRASGYVKWQIKRGQRFTTNFRAKSDVYVAIDPNDDEDDMQREFDLYTCSADLAPSRVGDPEVEHQGKIYLDLSKSSKRLKIEGGATLKPLSVEIVIKLGADKGVLLVEALHEKIVIGTARIDYGATNTRKALQ